MEDNGRDIEGRTCAHPSQAIPCSAATVVASTRAPDPSTVCEYAEPRELRRAWPFGLAAWTCAASLPIHSLMAIWLVDWRSAVGMGWGIYACAC